MKARKLSIPVLIVICLWGCRKENSNEQTLPIPNGDFELWNDIVLIDWQTNPCTYCVPPFETYVVQKVTDAAHGQYAAKFIFNGLYSSYAINKFPFSQHPASMTGYLKSNIAGGDTVTIRVDLFYKNNITDSGYFFETSSMAQYTKIEIPISQNSSALDSALINITGGKKQGTELYVDNLEFLIKN